MATEPEEAAHHAPVGVAHVAFDIPGRENQQGGAEDQ
jgi:hypothetical protein